MKRFLLSLMIALTICGIAASGVGAVTDSVSVLLPDFNEGATVGGVVPVRVIAAAPEPITSVEYFVDDALLAKVVLAPFSYDWDTTRFAPGSHRLTAQATDRSGHTGETSVRLNIVAPLQVTFSAPQDVIPIGQPIKLKANITAINAVTQVDLVVDNQVLSSDTTPPDFDLTLNTSQLQPGVHQVTIRIQDNQGNLARASLPLKFEVVPDYTWVSVLLVVGLIAAVVAAGFAVWRTIQVVRRSYWRIYQLQLCNEGNVPARYEILATDPAGALKFKLLLNGVTLNPETPVKTTARSVPPAPSASTPAQPKTSTKTNVREKSGLLVDLAYTISTIIPNTSLGRNLAQWASTARNIDYSAQRLEYAGQQAQSLGGAQSTASPITYNSAYAAEPASSVAPPATPQPVTQLKLTPGAWCTPYLQPGDMLALTLSIDPGRPVQTQHYTFQVSSRAVDPEQEVALVETGQLQVDSVPLIKYYLPFFIIASVVIGATIIIAILLANAGAFG